MPAVKREGREEGWVGKTSDYSEVLSKSWPTQWKPQRLSIQVLLAGVARSQHVLHVWSLGSLGVGLNVVGGPEGGGCQLLLFL